MLIKHQRNFIEMRKNRHILMDLYGIVKTILKTQDPPMHKCVNLVDFENNAVEKAFSLKNRIRYSRERALHNLGNNPRPPTPSRIKKTSLSTHHLLAVNAKPVTADLDQSNDDRV